MHQSILKLLCVGILSAFILPVCAQNSLSADTLSSAFARSLFAKANSAQSRLNNGREYISTNPRTKGHPFFETNVWTEGNITYDGAEFNNVKMLYDVEKDEVVVLNFLLQNKLSLVKQKVESFRIHQHQFIYLQTDSLNKESSGGFYDLLYDQGLAVLAKRKKEIKEINNTSREASFIPADEYYFMKDATLHPVKTLGSIAKLLETSKAEINQHLRKNGIIFRENPEKAMVSIALYHDQLSK
ncbi:MAG: hypothetical protein WBJ10_07655 [Daejeonella sp.]|uniref:hypothetical protein n=1 Tax=Daejeonella sp. TaxID=2805397 RepID=UPI003C7955A8